MVKLMDRLPNVISCCLCCFLRAGTILIALVSFIFGCIFAPNVSHAPGFWDIKDLLVNFNEATEMGVQFILGVVSILLCIVSILLLVGACCNFPVLIEIYQWGAIIFSTVVVMLFFILTGFCFFVNTTCLAAGVIMIFINFLIVLFTIYFVLVANSYRMTLNLFSTPSGNTAA